MADETKLIWERFVSPDLNADGCLWVYATESELEAALGPDHEFHHISISVAKTPAEAIDYRLPEQAAELKELLA